MPSIIFFNTHPIQYFVPLYQELAKEPSINLKVLYCSDETLKGATDQQFGVKVLWDIPLLEGYDYQFLKNYSFKPSIFKGFWGLMNWGVIRYFKKAPKSTVVVHGWSSFSHVLTIIAASLFGHTVCLRAETPMNQEVLKKPSVRAIKNLWLRFLFLFVDRFLYIGKQNKLFYESFGIKGSTLFFTPYAVDNKRFQHISHSVDKATARKQMSLPIGRKIFLFSGKYIEKKRPLDLLEAFFKMGETNNYLVMVGDGELRPQMEAYIQEHHLLGNVLLTGFVNQSAIPFYYASADYFVMCSGIGETWGLSVNEAMNFKLPVIVSDICGCSFDLVDNGTNGFVFEAGNITALHQALTTISSLDSQQEGMGAASLRKIDQYSYRTIIESLKKVAYE